MKNLLVQLDSDPHASVFDRVVAVDAGADQVFSYGGVKAGDVRNLVYGAMFTRSPGDLHHTAVFIGGSDVAAGEALLEEARQCFFGPLSVSLMMDSSGSNTTAAAAVLAARKHVDLAGCRALVLGGTGPVGQRAGRLLAREGAHVRLGSRSRERAAKVCNALRSRVGDANVEPCGTQEPTELAAAIDGVELVVAAGAAGVTLLPADVRRASRALRVAIDLNAVPPAGIEGVAATDKGVEHDGVVCYGAVGVGGTKMKIHKAALAKLFTAKDLVLDAEEIYEIGRELASG